MGALALLMTPIAYYTRHLMRRVWPLTPRVVEMAGRLQRTLLASVVAYALLALGARLFATYAHAGACLAASPSWSLLAFTLAAFAAALAWLMPQSRKR